MKNCEQQKKYIKNNKQLVIGKKKKKKRQLKLIMSLSIFVCSSSFLFSQKNDLENDGEIVSFHLVTHE